MKNRIIFGVAGTMILLSLLLFNLTGQENWLWLGVFVGANLVQSAFTKWCLLATILDKFEIKN
ncbi:YgaP family membrane protein [Cytophaga aurantiaca]|uniref:YgaP family membrane protein n=1 Tax=Cytophaga aurantiaca TaxID=29530 RepID=UPI0003657CB2|nr:DUF2892 domain-containing protein [Cytophaga aurantiaca]